MDKLRFFNGILWSVLGLLILVWLLLPSEMIELIIWIGFSIGCLLIGVFEIRDQLGSD